MILSPTFLLALALFTTIVTGFMPRIPSPYHSPIYTLTLCQSTPLPPLHLADEANLDTSISPPMDPPKLRKYRRILSTINPFKKDDEPIKAKLLKLGLAAFLSYGFVSNMTYAVLLSCSYFVFTTKTGITPLAPGQRAPFLAVYTGFFVLNNFLRPVRLAVAASLAPYMERVIVKIQTKLKCSRPVATGMVVFLFNIVGTFSAMYVGLNLAALFSGVPVEFSRLFASITP